MVPLTETVKFAFGERLNEIRNAIECYNKPGNIEGLFSRYTLAKDSISWNVGCLNNEWLEENRTTLEQGNHNQLAVLGYSLAAEKGQAEFKEAFRKGIGRLKSKDPFPGDRISFAFAPRSFLGIVVGICTLEDEKKQNDIEWFEKVLTKRTGLESIQPSAKMIYSVIHSILSGHSIDVFMQDLSVDATFDEYCLLLWGLKRGFFTTNDPRLQENIKRKILTGFVQEPLPDEQWLYPLVLFGVQSCLLESVDNVILSNAHISRLLSNFESSMRKWRWCAQNKWLINDEYDIQAILYLILRSVFDDVVDEDPTQKFGHGSSRIDFRIPSLKLIVEAKYVRRREDFKRIEDEIKIDSIDYLHSTDCDSLIVFIYDNSASVEEHQTTIQSLKKIEAIADVIIASKPSHIGV